MYEVIIPEHGGCFGIYPFLWQARLLAQRLKRDGNKPVIIDIDGHVMEAWS